MYDIILNYKISFLNSFVIVMKKWVLLLVLLTSYILVGCDNVKLEESFELYTVESSVESVVEIEDAWDMNGVDVGWVWGTDKALEEVQLNGEKFPRKPIFVVMTKYIAPVLLFIILLNSFGLFG